ncbi:hypothetical protein, partial [Methylobacterium platani]|uniref:hypothetical protein n=1 Tax=Methylobacterium platani TaxID=427683 RepID=UPI001AEC9181
SFHFVSVVRERGRLTRIVRPYGRAEVAVSWTVHLAVPACVSDLSLGRIWMIRDIMRTHLILMCRSIFDRLTPPDEVEGWNIPDYLGFYRQRNRSGGFSA